MVGLVDDHEIERLREQPIGMLAPARERERSDDPRRRPEALGVFAKQRVVRGHAGNIELGLQFLAPLSDQRGGDQHQHALDHAAQQIFLEHHACLDGLAEAHLVGEQHAAAKLFQYLAHGLGLVPEGLDAPQMRHAQQFVEAFGQAEAGEPLAQGEPAAVALGSVGRGGEHRLQVRLDDQGNIDADLLQSRYRGRRRRRRLEWRRRGRGRFGRRGNLRARRRRRGLDRRLAAANLGLAAHDGVDRFGEPAPPRTAAGKSGHGVPPIGQAVLLEQGSGADPVFLARQSESREEMIRFSREITFGVTLEIEGRLVRSTVEQGRRSGEGQDSRIARAGSLRLFGQLQKPVGP